MNVTWVGAHPNNFKVGRDGKGVEYIILHHAVGSLGSVDSTFKDGKRQASAHYCIGRNGVIHQYVKEADTSYNAGVWDVNLKSISIEHEDLARDDFTDLEYETSAQLITEICRRWNLNETNIHAHRDFHPTACPGSLDMNRIITRVKQLLQLQGGIMTDQDLAHTGYNFLFQFFFGHLPIDPNAWQYIGIVAQRTGKSWAEVTCDAFKEQYLDEMNAFRASDCPTPPVSGNYQPVAETLYRKVS